MKLLSSRNTERYEFLASIKTRLAVPFCTIVRETQIMDRNF